MKLKRLLVAWSLSLLCASSPLLAVRVRLSDGTPVRLRLKADLLTASAQTADRVDYEVVQPVYVQGLLVIPAGSVAWGAVQSVKEDKEIKFDIQGVRLPDLRELKLRSIREKTKNPGKDVIKVETKVAGDVGARAGREFTGYVDEDVYVEAIPAPAATTPATQSAPAAPQPVVSSPTANPVMPTGAQPAVTTPATASRPEAATLERVTVECFSTPSGADILVDGDFYGNTPSILKLTATTHQIEIRLAGHKSHSAILNLVPGAGIRTIRASLETRE